MQEYIRMIFFKNIHINKLQKTTGQHKPQQQQQQKKAPAAAVDRTISKHSAAERPPEKIPPCNSRRRRHPSGRTSRLTLVYRCSRRPFAGEAEFADPLFDDSLSL